MMNLLQFIRHLFHEVISGKITGNPENCGAKCHGCGISVHEFQKSAMAKFPESQLFSNNNGS